jgi:four helix bundle protein
MVDKKVKDFDDLEIYQLSLDLADGIYDLTATFPSEERYNTTSQLRKAAASIGANIAEGYGRFHYKENIQFCRQSRGSLAETKHFMLFSKRRSYIKQKTYDDFLLKYRHLQVKINNYISSIGKHNSMTIV